MKAERVPANLAKRLQSLEKSQKKYQKDISSFKDKLIQDKQSLAKKELQAKKLFSNLESLQRGKAKRAGTKGNLNQCSLEKILACKKEIKKSLTVKKEDLQSLNVCKKKTAKAKQEISFLNAFKKEVNEISEQEEMLSIKNHLKSEQEESLPLVVPLKQKSIYDFRSPSNPVPSYEVAPLDNQGILMEKDYSSSKESNSNFEKDEFVSKDNDLELDYEDNAGCKYSIQLRLDENEHLEVDIVALESTERLSQAKIQQFIAQAGFQNFVLSVKEHA